MLVSFYAEAFEKGNTRSDLASFAGATLEVKNDDQTTQMPEVLQTRPVTDSDRTTRDRNPYEEFRYHINRINRALGVFPDIADKRRQGLYKEIGTGQINTGDEIIEIPEQYIKYILEAFQKHLEPTE
jgi:hypothetical protein